MNKLNLYSRFHLLIVSFGWSIIIFSLSELGILFTKSWLFLIVTFLATCLFVLYSKFGLYTVPHQWTYKKFVIVTTLFLTSIVLIFSNFILLSFEFFHRLAYSIEVLMYLFTSLLIPYSLTKGK
jgi:hypothetical protein